jgi:hypothetical protein
MGAVTDPRLLKGEELVKAWAWEPIPGDGLQRLAEGKPRF